MGRGACWVVAVSCALSAALFAVPQALGQRESVSLMIPVGNVALPPSLAGGVVGGLATDASGNVYAGVNKAGEAFVAAFNRDGMFLRQWKVDPFITLRYAVALAVGRDGLVYVAPSGFDDELVRVFTSEGVLVRSFGQGSGLREVTDIELDAGGNVYVTARARADRGLPDDMVVRFNPAGAVAARLVPAPGKAHQFGNALYGLGVAADGSIYVTTDTLDTSFPDVVGLSAAGAAIPVPDFAFVVPGDRHRFQDVDVAGGKLYFAGEFVETRGRNPFGVAVLTPQGRLLDLVVGEGRELAVAGADVYATRIHARRSPAARTPATHIAGEFGHIRHEPVRPAGPGIGNAVGDGQDPACKSLPQSRDPLTGVVTVSVPLGIFLRCDVVFTNVGHPCPTGSSPVGNPDAYLDGDPIAGATRHQSSNLDYTHVRIRQDQTQSGPLVFEWTCRSRTGQDSKAYEWKGNLWRLIDPSGTVVDARTGRPVEGATVRLEFALRRGSPFGTPSISGFTPQINPQVTSRSGFFGWDVAPGFWRLRITSFGYRPLTSPIYVVPPEHKNLRLALRPNAAQQARVIDPFAGRVGTVRVGARVARGKRVAGLALRARGGRLRGVTIKSKRFRTTAGVALGSTETALRDAFTPEVTAVLMKARTRPSKYKVGKATFSVKRGRVVGIVLRR